MSDDDKMNDEYTTYHNEEIEVSEHANDDEEVIIYNLLTNNNYLSFINKLRIYLIN